MDENFKDERRLPVVNKTRVVVWRGRVMMAPPGYAVMGPNKWGRLLATNGNEVIEMHDVGEVVDDDTEGDI